MKKTVANIFINTSRGISDPDIELMNEYKIEGDGIEYNKIRLELETSFDCSDKIIQYKMEQIAKLYTLVISKFELDLKLGCPYFTLDWKNKNVQNNAEISFSNNTMKIIEKIELCHRLIGKKINVIKLQDLHLIYDNNYIDNEYNNLLLDNYYSACFSDAQQSKFFYLFSIFELYEKSDFFKNNPNKKLFSNDEINGFLDLVEKSDNYERKKAILSELKNRTLKNRAEKFFEYLNTKYIDIVKKNNITIDDLQSIINQRNKLFHASSVFNNEVLFDKLFPIIKELLLNDLFNS
jgi:hypothetical protein